MCICINCRHINRCTTYQLIKRQHKISKKSLEPIEKFFPSNNIIQINIKFKSNIVNTILDWDITECLSFIEEPGAWLNT